MAPMKPLYIRFLFKSRLYNLQRGLKRVQCGLRAIGYPLCEKEPYGPKAKGWSRFPKVPLPWHLMALGP